MPKVDDAPSGLLRQADTAGEAFHAWRVSRKLDVDEEALPHAKRGFLTEIVGSSE